MIASAKFTKPSRNKSIIAYRGIPNCAIGCQKRLKIATNIFIKRLVSSGLIWPIDGSKSVNFSSDRLRSE